MIEHIFGDVRSSFRTSVKAPAFALPVIATIALAIGSTTVTFAVVDLGLYLQPARPEMPLKDVQADVEVFWRAVDENYAYFDRRTTRWSQVPALYAADVAGVRTRRELLVLLEQMIDELHDHHAHMTANTSESWRLVPAGADIWAEWRDGRAGVVDVSPGSAAARAGLAAGARVIAVAGQPIERAIDARLGRSMRREDEEARSWALRSLLAGRRNRVRTIEFQGHQGTRTVQLREDEQAPGDAGRLSYRVLPGNRAYIRLHDSLGHHDLVGDFDRALYALRETSSLILDLRDTPSGGNTAVARGILGRFVPRELPYQKHSQPRELRDAGVARTWLELVSPRGPFRYSRPVAVLVSRWTGSMGEGLAIGFDAAGVAEIVGTPMAGLLGATYHVQLPHSGLGVNIPAEQLFHVNGTPREAFVPRHVVSPSTPTQDPWMDKASSVLAR